MQHESSEAKQVLYHRNHSQTLYLHIILGASEAIKDLEYRFQRYKGILSKVKDRSELSAKKDHKIIVSKADILTNSKTNKEFTAYFKEAQIPE